MAHLNCYATGTIEISEENKVKLYAICYDKCNNKETDVYLYLTKAENENELDFTLKHDNEDSYRFIISYLNYYGNIKTFHGEITDIESDDYEVKYTFNDGKFYECWADVENVYNNLGTFEEFKPVILKRKDVDSFDSSVSGVEYKHILGAAECSENQKQFFENLETLSGVQIDLYNEELDISMSIERTEDAFQDTTSISIILDDEGDVVFHIDSIFAEFKNYKEYQFKPDVYTEHESIQVEPDIEVQFEFDGEIMIGFVPYVAAKKVILEADAKVPVKNEWIRACEVCDKRLQKEIKGCFACDFNQI